ncbi:MAG: T9SS type A sorting domain-containing protein [Bacteroidia bacterium]
MKNLFIALLFSLLMICANEANAQFRILKIDSSTLLRDTLQYGDSVDFVYKVKNISDSDLIFNDTIMTYIKTDLDTTPLLIDSRIVFISNAGSVEIKTRFAITSPYFINNRLTEITIWPEVEDDAAFSPNFDSIKQLVLVVPTVSIAEEKNMLNYVRFYPNPVQDIVYLETLKPEIKIKRITLRDLQGRSIFSYNTGIARNSVDLKNYKPGVYLLEVEYSSNKTGMYRIIKTQ